MKKCKSFLWCCLLPFAALAQPAKLSLQEAVQLALQNNFNVVISRNNTDISKINNNWATAGALPVISASTNKTFGSNNLEQELSNGTTIKTDGAKVNNFNAGLSVSWRFFDGFAMFATKKRLEELEKGGQYAFRKTSNETAYQVMESYYNIIRLQQQVLAIEEAIGLYEERKKIAEARFNIGTAAKPDLLQAEVDLNEQKSTLLSLRNSIELAKVELNTLMARDVQTPIVISDSFVLGTSPDTLQIRLKMEQQHPDVLLAQNNLAVLIQSKREINAQRLPTADLNSNYNFVRNKNTAGFNLLNQTYGPSVSIGVAIPIFNGGVVKRQLKVADINIKNQDVALQQLKTSLRSNIALAHLNYKNALDQVALENNNLTLIRENNLINLERFRKLAITSVELRQGQISYTDAQTRLINAQYQAKVAEASLQLLSGEIAQ